MAGTSSSSPAARYTTSTDTTVRLALGQSVSLGAYYGRPHFHARYGQYRDSLDLAGEIIVGEFPRRQLRLVQAWTDLHADEIKADWELAASEYPLNPIEPLADHAFFAQVRVDPEIGTAVWPNGVDMAPETLYERACEHQVRGSSRIPA